jgi:hypothetical protein
MMGRETMDKRVDTGAEPMPVEGDQVIVDAVIADHRERAEFGKKKYGKYLQSNNGRNALVDLYQELMDGSLYVKQALVEYDDIRAMALKQLWKTGDERPSAPGKYPVHLSNQDGNSTTTGWTIIYWDGEKWGLDVFAEGVYVSAWFDIPPYEVKP